MDDKFHRNKKVRKLRKLKGGREAIGCWTFWWSWCLDDPDLTGFVPEDELDAADKKSAVLLCSDLHDGRGLWVAAPGGYQIHDFHNYNPTREQREKKLTADRDRAAAKRADEASDVARDSQKNRARLAGDVANESPPRARAGHGMGTYSERDTRYSASSGDTDPASQTGDVLDLHAAGLRKVQP
jgi:hypothetical protein